MIGDAQIRNRGTIGGSVCHFDPAADYPPVLALLDARFHVAGAGGERVIPARDFFTGYMATALRPDEILTEVRVPDLAPETGTAYAKFARTEGGFAVVGVAASIALDSGRACRSVRVVLGGVAPVPVRLADIEKAKPGKKVDEGFIDEVGEAAFSAAAQPSAELHAEAAYKREMARVFARRALAAALARATSGSKSV